jgi:hypothetical protein
MTKNEKIIEFYKHVQPEEESSVLLSMVLGDLEIYNKNLDLANSSNFYSHAGLSGRVDILKLRIHGSRWLAIASAVANDRMELITWFLENSEELESMQNKTELLQLITQFGKLEQLKFLLFYSDDLVWTEKISELAALNGHTHILEYAWENNFPINLEKVCFSAVHGYILDNKSLRCRKKNGTGVCWNFLMSLCPRYFQDIKF